MRNVLATECMKLRRNKLMLVCTLIAVLLPLILVIQEVGGYGGEMPEDSGVTWVLRLSSFLLLIVYPILSGFVITFLIQREYADHTMITTLTAPVSRARFLTGKIIVWAIWHMTIYLLYLLIMAGGVRALYSSDLFIEYLPGVCALVLKLGFFNLCTFTPIVWVAVLQRKAFYPSLLCTLVFTGLGFAGLFWPDLFGSVVPWAAVTHVSVPGVEAVSGVAYASIGICAMLGLLMAMYSFKHQEL